MFLVDGVGQGSVFFNNLGKVCCVLIEFGAAVHGHGDHIVQVARQVVYHLVVWCAVMF